MLPHSLPPTQPPTPSRSLILTRSLQHTLSNTPSYFLTASYSPLPHSLPLPHGLLLPTPSRPTFLHSSQPPTPSRPSPTYHDPLFLQLSTPSLPHFTFMLHFPSTPSLQHVTLMLHFPQLPNTHITLVSNSHPTLLIISPCSVSWILRVLTF
ncbi:hypothetical protein Pcinc_033373 [Petrolisthes cinctipes]|uniref:Uncharacterized protein n=1 Tax=Petrolisthes cinctipes TaxID=88211 RepID=A0AAE1JXJ1_PETCI|nr:hypothetical protein Pcinc_033373 [Petrolisthes cinctipes]